jgi:hypothetical protein
MDRVCKMGHLRWMKVIITNHYRLQDKAEEIFFKIYFSVNLLYVSDSVLKKSIYSHFNTMTVNYSINFRLYLYCCFAFVF